MESLGHTDESQGHIPNGKMSVQFFLKDLRESVDNQYSQSKCENVERPVTSRTWFQWSCLAVSHDREGWVSIRNWITGAIQFNSLFCLSRISHLLQICSRTRLNEKLLLVCADYCMVISETKQKYSGLQCQHLGQLCTAFLWNILQVSCVVLQKL